VQQCNGRRRCAGGGGGARERGRGPLESEQKRVARQETPLSTNGTNGANGTNAKTARDSIGTPLPTNVTNVICVINVTTAQWARNSLREEGLIRDDIMLAHEYHPGPLTGQHTPRSIWEITEKGRQWLRQQGGTTGR